MAFRTVAVVVALGICLASMSGPFAGGAQACSCSGPSGADEELRYSDAVFTGEMTRDGIEDPRPDDGAMFGGVEFRVDESWKGVSGESAVVYGQALSYYGKLEEGKMYVESSCAYSFSKGESYLVYATRYEDGFQVEPCSGTASLDDAGEDVRVLNASVERLTDTGGPPLAGVLVAAVAGLLSAGLLFRWARN